MAWRSNLAAWSLLAATASVSLVWLAFSAMTMVWSSVLPPVALVGVLVVVGRFYRRRDQRLCDAVESVSHLIGFFVVIGTFSYLAATFGLPYRDGMLFAADRALGLDWLAYMKAINDRPWLGSLLRLAYLSFLPQIVLIVLTLAFSGHGAVARRMVLAMILAGIVTVAISGIVPAVAMYAHLGLTPADYPNLSPAAAFVHMGHLEALRSGAPMVLDLAKTEGIVTFPSYHAAVALLLLLGGWAHPWLRWPVVTINLAMIAATPVDGGHYFVDVAAGLALAALCHVAAGALISPARHGQRPAMAMASEARG